MNNTVVRCKLTTRPPAHKVQSILEDTRRAEPAEQGLGAEIVFERTMIGGARINVFASRKQQWCDAAFASVLIDNIPAWVNWINGGLEDYLP